MSSISMQRTPAILAVLVLAVLAVGGKRRASQVPFEHGLVITWGSFRVCSAARSCLSPGHGSQGHYSRPVTDCRVANTPNPVGTL